MEAKLTDLPHHLTVINSTLMEVCRTSVASPLVTDREEQGMIVVNTFDHGSLSRKVQTDLGSSEVALRLPIPDVAKPRFWIAMHEQWAPISRHRIRFHECGLRLYLGSVDEDAIQIVRLEWVAPTKDPEGVPSYQGKHAGHPHWHIDRGALVGPADYLHSLDVLTTPDAESEMEDFSSAEVSGEPARPRLDCSWLQNVHLPAQARWAELLWDGQEIPGPHQNEPSNIQGLTNWWSGALRYFSTELSH
jgi:hypothetical protein